MYRFRFLLTQASILLLIASCSSGVNNNIPTYIVSRKNFENSIRIAGFVEPVSSTSVVCARGIDGFVDWLVEEGTYVEEGDVLCVIDDTNLETRYDDILTRLEQAQTNLARTIADLNMQYAILEAQVKSNEAESEVARMDSLELLYYSPNQRKIREYELEIAQINKARYEKKLEALKIIQQSEIRRREIEVMQWTSQVKTVKDLMEQLTVKAPKAGLVVLPMARQTGLTLKLGDNVWSGTPIVTLPETKTMKIKMQATETDYRQINLNDSIVYRFDAMPDNVGIGKIVNRAYVGQPVKSGSQVKLFEMEGSIDSVGTMPDPGFTTNCNIILKEVKDVIVVPQIAVFDQDSIKVVYVQNGRDYEMRQVKPGLTSLKEAIIEEGLDEGEVIALMRPSERATRKRVLLPVADSTSVEKPASSADSVGIKPVAAEGLPGITQLNEINK